MAHVLIGFAEALPAPEVVFSLLRDGHEVSAFALGSDVPLRHLPLKAWHVVPAPDKAADATAEAVRQLMEGVGRADLVLPLDDAGLWVVNRAGIAPDRIAGASGEQARAALDKSIQIDAAREAGLAVPDTHVIRSLEDLAGVALPQPGIAKPALALEERGGQLGKGGAFYLDESTGADTFAAALETSGPMLVQPLVAGVGEGVFGFATDTGVVGWSGHQRVRMMNPHGSGSSACRRTVPSETLRAQVSAFVERLGWRGAFMVELLRDAEGTPWFIELNGRMWGSLALARRQGLEYPAWAVKQALHHEFCPDIPDMAEAPGTLRNLGREILHLAFVLRGPKSSFHREDWPSFWRSAAAVLRPAPGRNFYNHDPAYRGFKWRDAAWTVKRALKR